MKSLLTLFIAILISVTPAKAECNISCTVVTLSGTLTTQTLSSGNIYLLSGCVVVPDNVTITVQAGTRIMGEKATHGTLLFKKGAKFVSQGTTFQPVIFTSDQTSTCRAPGDWGGIIFEGKAPNNNNNSITITGTVCTGINGGGTIATDNSGVLKYMRIEYAEFGLRLLSVGSGTEMHHVQIAYSSQDGLQLLGGTVNAKELVLFNNYGIDLLSSLGNVSKVQCALCLRLDPNAYSAAAVSAVVIKNNDNAPNYESYTGSQNTHPEFSNFTILGPAYCGASLGTAFENAVLFKNNAEGLFYNSYIDGWKNGLNLQGNQTIENANHSTNPKLRFEYNSLYNNVNEGTSSLSIWPSGGCAPDLDLWMFGSFPCNQKDNEKLVTAGYDNSVCGNYKISNPSFSLSSTLMALTNYDELSSGFFEIMNNRGAFDASDWTLSWTNWNPKDVNYCPSLKTLGLNLPMTELKDALQIQIAPNPAKELTQLHVQSSEEGIVQLRVVNSIGQVVLAQTHKLYVGEQVLAIDIQTWSAGMYFVSVQTGQGNVVNTNFIVQ